MQQQLDAGLQLCEPCDTFGWHTFCGECGKRYVGRELRWRECPGHGCRARVTTEFCPLCGTLVAGEFLRKLEKGLVDWKAESRAAAEAARVFLRRFPDRAGDLLEDFQPPSDAAGDVAAMMNGAIRG